MDFKEKKISSKEIYRNSFLKIYEDDVELPNKIKTKRIHIKHPGAAAVLPITIDGKIILTKQFRYALGGISIEIPAGKKDSLNETGLNCVIRELEEETGYTSNKITHLYNTHNCVGYSNELIELFLAENCMLKENPLTSDEDEFIEVVLYEIDEVLRLIQKGIITDAKTILTIQHYLLSKSK